MVNAIVRKGLQDKRIVLAFNGEGSWLFDALALWSVARQRVAYMTEKTAYLMVATWKDVLGSPNALQGPALDDPTSHS